MFHKSENAFVLALSFSLSLFPGFTGLTSFFGFMSLFIALIFRVQLGAYFIGYFAFSLLSIPFLTYFDSIGESLLMNESLNPFWTQLYQWPVMHWLNFNHTTSLGGQVFALLLIIPSFFIFHFLILKYQTSVVQRLKSNKLYNSFMKSSLVLKYNTILESLGQ